MFKISYVAFLSIAYSAQDQIEMPFGRPLPSSQSLHPSFLRMKRLGVGGSFNAGVYLVKRRRDGKKCVEKGLQDELIASGAAEFEIFVLSELKHENVVEYIDAFVVRNGRELKASLYMEHCDGGTLDDYIKRYHMEGRFAMERFVWSMFMQLANAIAYCQYGIKDAVAGGQPEEDWIGVVHRDIKPDNIFLRASSGGFQAVLGDFGQAIREDDQGNWGRTYQGGAPLWAAPESQKSGYEYASDVWAIGAVVQFLCRQRCKVEVVGLGNMTTQCYWGVGLRYSDFLDVAVHALIQRDPGVRPKMWDFAPHLRRWSRQSETAI